MCFFFFQNQILFKNWSIVALQCCINFYCTEKWISYMNTLVFPVGSVVKDSIYQCRRGRRCGFDPWVRKIPWRRKWQPAPVFLPGKPHGHRSLAGYSPKGRKESDMTKHTGTAWDMGSQFSDQELNPDLQQWKLQALTTGLPGNSRFLIFSYNKQYCPTFHLQTGTLSSLTSNSHLTTPKPQVITVLLSVSVHLTVLGISYK